MTANIRKGAALLCALLLASGAAQGQLFRAYLASNGNDSNACTLSAPCRLLPRALATVASGGEIWMLDSANYNVGPVNVSKSVSILAVPGAVGSVLAIGGPAIEITSPGHKVALRNLVIGPLSGGAPGTEGIFVSSASTVTIENSLIANIPGDGVGAEGAATVRIANSVIRNNDGHAVAAANGASVKIAATKMLGNGDGGVLAFADAASPVTTASISDSVISGGIHGVKAHTTAANASTRITMTRSSVEDTDHAVTAETNNTGTARAAVSYSMLVNSSVHSWHQSGAGSTINSLGNNHVTDNAGSLGAVTPVTPQ